MDGADLAVVAMALSSKSFRDIEGLLSVRRVRRTRREVRFSSIVS